MHTTRCHLKGQAILLDAGYSTVICITMILLCVLSVNSLLSSYLENSRAMTLEARAISIADYLVKEKLAMKTESAFGEISRIRIIDSDKVDSLEFGEDVCIALEDGVCEGTCVRRAVVAEEASYLVVCVR